MKCVMSLPGAGPRKSKYSCMGLDCEIKSRPLRRLTLRSRYDQICLEHATFEGLPKNSQCEKEREWAGDIREHVL